jgi:hypothetical protein
MQKIDDLVCWRCGASLHDEPLPLARESTCRGCGADLHVCRLCEYYDTRVANDCREPIADKVTNKVKSNFCGYLRPRPHAYNAADPAALGARQGLESLFGLDTGSTSASPTTSDAARNALDDLFGRK